MAAFQSLRESFLGERSCITACHWINTARGTVYICREEQSNSQQSLWIHIRMHPLRRSLRSLLSCLPLQMNKCFAVYFRESHYDSLRSNSHTHAHVHQPRHSTLHHHKSFVSFSNDSCV